MVKLQVALDIIDIDKLRTAAQMAVAGGADIIEVGTPSIKAFGLGIVKELHEKYPDKEILADMKCADTGFLEVEIAAKSGASIVTVLGGAPDETIIGAVEAGKKYKVKVMVDLLDVKGKKMRSMRLGSLGVDYICLHTGIDEQNVGRDPLRYIRDVRRVTEVPIAVAGGLDKFTVPKAIGNGAEIVIVGGAITKSKDPKAATEEILAAMHGEQNVTNVKSAMRLLSDYINDTVESISQEHVNKMIETLLKSNKVFVIGAGRSGLVAKAFAMRLMHLGFDVHVVGETTAPALDDKDLLIVISGSGETKYPISIARSAKEAGGKVVAVTSYPGSKLGGMADIVVRLEGRSMLSNGETRDWTKRQLHGLHQKLTPLGTMFEVGTWLFLEGVVAELMNKKQMAEEDMKKLHTNIE